MADHDTDWILISSMFYKRSQVQQGLQTCFDQEVCEDDQQVDLTSPTSLSVGSHIQ